MRLKKFFSLCICACLVTGCGANTDTKDTDTEITTDMVTTQSSETPVSGGTLKIAMNTPQTLNPLENADVTVDNVLKLIYEPLIYINNNMEVQPNIAESIEPHEKYVTITVKDGLKWQDGKAIGADDVVYSLDRIKSAGANSLYKGCLLNVRYYEQTGDKTLDVYYSEPVGAVSYNFDFPVIPKHYFRENKDADFEPMGSGSYEFDSYKLAHYLNLKATDGINGKPYIDNISAVIIPDEQTRLNALDKGIVDIYQLDCDEIGSISNKLASNSKMYPTNMFEYIGFNMQKSIFTSFDVRQALAYIMPVDDIIKGIYLNNMTKSVTPFNPDNAYVLDNGVENYDYNQNTANTLLLASGLTKEDFSFKILVNSENTSRVETARKLSQSFNNFGMNTDVEAVSFEEYQNRLKSGNFDMYIGCVELTANMNVSQLVGTNGSVNFTSYQNPTLDEYIAKVNSSPDFDSYKTNLNELNKYLSYELPVVGIGFKKRALVYSKNVKGNIYPIFNDCFYNIKEYFIKA